ncbi:MAG TPA: hypothetical protein VGM15_03105 [Burkholderiaceae bacterium]|jgi:hypothetical protein
MVSAKGVLRNEGFAYALDNGAWHSYIQARPFDRVAFLKAVEMLGRDADFIVIPDIVGSSESLAFSLGWLDTLADYKKLMLPVQDGMTAQDVTPWLSERIGCFVGGTTEWKLRTMAMWAHVAHAAGAECHVGRVNSVYRIRACAAAGVDSFDGSNASRYAVNLAKLDVSRRIADLFAQGDKRDA